MVSFQEYLETCRFEESPEATFVEEALADGRLSGAKTWDDLHSQLIGRSEIDPLDLEAARSVWEAYVQAQGHLA